MKCPYDQQQCEYPRCIMLGPATDPECFRINSVNLRNSMNNLEYAEACRRTDTDKYQSAIERISQVHIFMILHALMGITTECGELMDQLKKHLIYGKELDTTNIIEEDGDLRWYLSLLEFACNYTADEAQERNIDKLRVRYPNKFNEVDALVRNLNKERMILEK